MLDIGRVKDLEAFYSKGLWAFMFKFKVCG